MTHCKYHHTHSSSLTPPSFDCDSNTRPITLELLAAKQKDQFRAVERLVLDAAAIAGKGGKSPQPQFSKPRKDTSSVVTVPPAKLALMVSIVVAEGDADWCIFQFLQGHHARCSRGPSSLLLHHRPWKANDTPG